MNKYLYHRFTMDIHFFPTIDLFASRLNKQISTFLYRPDPECSGVNAFSISWKHKDFYAFPPFAIVGRVLQKIEPDEASGIIVVPDWPTQCWCRKYTYLRIKDIVLPPRSDLLKHPLNPAELHPLHKSLALRVGLLCGKQ